MDIEALSEVIEQTKNFEEINKGSQMGVLESRIKELSFENGLL